MPNMLGVPVRLFKAGPKIAIAYPRGCKGLTRELKKLRGYKWDFANQAVVVTDNPRNRICITSLLGKTPKELLPYSLPITPYTGGRDCLMAHQRERMIPFLLTRKRCILAAEQGTGKTLSAIEALEQVKRQRQRNGDEAPFWWITTGPALVKSTAREFDKWQAGNVPTRVMSYAKLARFSQEYDGPPPVGVVFDESEFVKSPKAGRSKAAQWLADECEYVWLLSGTPAPKNPCDWWKQVEIARPGFLRESSYGKLQERLAIIQKVDYGTGRVVPQVVGWREDEVAAFGRELEPIVMVIRSADCQDLPELLHERIEIEPTESLKRTAKFIAGQCATVAESLQKLGQLSDGFQYETDTKIDCPKDEALAGLLDRYDSAGRIIVLARYQASVDRCQDVCSRQGWLVLRADGRGLKPPEGYSVQDCLKALDRSTDRGDPAKLAIVGNAKTIGRGLNLTSAPATVFYSQDYNLGDRLQACKRGHREGMDVQRGHVIYDLIHLPIDRIVLEKHEAKARLQDLTMDEIRRAHDAN